MREEPLRTGHDLKKKGDTCDGEQGCEDLAVPEGQVTEEPKDHRRILDVPEGEPIVDHDEDPVEGDRGDDHRFCEPIQKGDACGNKQDRLPAAVRFMVRAPPPRCGHGSTTGEGSMNERSHPLEFAEKLFFRRKDRDQPAFEIRDDRSFRAATAVERIP